jgi:Tol biopolymer transport system component
VSRDGRVLLTNNRIRWQMRVGDLSTANERDLSWFRSSYVLDISQDGSQLLFRDGRDDLYIRDQEGSAAVKLGSGFEPASLSPDGSRVATVRLSDNRPVVLPTREGETVELRQEAGDATSIHYSAIRWLPDGRRLLISAANAEGERIFVQDTVGGEARPVSPPGFSDPSPSPDGSRFAAIDAKGNIVLYPLDGGTSRPVPGEHLRCRLLRWTSDGGHLYAYRRGDLPGRLLRVDLLTGTEDVVRTLMPPDPTGVWRVHPVVVTPDGGHYAYSATENRSELYVYTGLR